MCWLLARIVACLNAGLHPGMGIIHADRDGRASFIYDLMEPVRPAVDRVVLGFARPHTFAEGECWEPREGFCRLDPTLISLVSPWAVRFGQVVTPVVREVTAIFAAPEDLPRRL